MRLGGIINIGSVPKALDRLDILCLGMKMVESEDTQQPHSVPNNMTDIFNENCNIRELEGENMSKETQVSNESFCKRKRSSESVDSEHSTSNRMQQHKEKEEGKEIYL